MYPFEGLPHLLRRARCLRVETGWIPVQAASFAYEMHPWLNGTADRSYIRVVVRLPGDAPSRKEVSHDRDMRAGWTTSTGIPGSSLNVVS